MRCLSLFLVIAITLAGCSRRSADAPTATLMVFCAAGLKKPVEAVAAQYRTETGTEVQLQFGGSATLLSQLRVAQKGDLFLSADDSTIADARKAAVIKEVIPVAKQHPVVAVSAGNPTGIHTLADLLREGIGVALANPEAASIGKVTKAVLGEQYAALAAHAKVNKPTVTEVAADVKLGTVDAAIIWDATARTFGLEIVEVPELTSHVENASAAVLSSAREPAQALRFARYLAAPEKGGAIFQANGFTPAGGEKWALAPEMILYHLTAK
jgi:molybdate transport system substrate-binding protein